MHIQPTFVVLLFSYHSSMDIQKLYQHYQHHPKVLIDSRQKVTSGIFFGLKGEKVDGGKYAAQAIENGCTLAIVSDRQYISDPRIVRVDDVLTTLQTLALYHRKQLAIPVIALTGTNGKTTTKELLVKVLECKYKVGYTRGNLNNHIGVPLTLLNMEPEAEIAVIEMGANQPGDIRELCQIALPTHGLITNIGKAHLEGFGSEEGVLKTKCELFDFLASHNGEAFVNGSDDRLVACSKRLKLKSHLFHTPDSVYAEWPVQNSPLVSIDLVWAGCRQHVHSNLSGVYNANNMVAAAAVGLTFGLSLKTIGEQLSTYIPENNRSQYTQTANNHLLVDAYNANPTSMLLALDNIRRIAMNGTRKLVILGDMFELGEDSIQEHQKIVNQLDKDDDMEVWVVGSRFGQTKRPKNCKHFATTDLLLDHLQKTTLRNKLILIKGSRGMRLERCLELL